MSSCVTEGSYNLIFIISIIISVLFLFSTAFYYDRFNRASTNRLSVNDIAIAKTMTLLSLIISIISIAILFILFFGFRKRVIGLYPINK